MDGVVVQLKDQTPYTVVPYLRAKCGDTENVGFRVYKDGLRLYQFDDMQDLGAWFGSVVIDGTFEMTPEK